MSRSPGQGSDQCELDGEQMGVCRYMSATDKAVRGRKLSPVRHRPEPTELRHSKQSSFSGDKQGLWQTTGRSESLKYFYPREEGTGATWPVFCTSLALTRWTSFENKSLQSS